MISVRHGEMQCERRTNAIRGHLNQFRGQSAAEFRAWTRQILSNDLREAQGKFRGAQQAVTEAKAGSESFWSNNEFIIGKIPAGFADEEWEHFEF